MHSVAHVLVSNYEMGNGQLGAKAVARIVVPEQYLALKPAISVPIVVIVVASHLNSGLGQQSQSVF